MCSTSGRFIEHCRPGDEPVASFEEGGGRGGREGEAGHVGKCAVSSNVISSIFF